MTNEEYSTLEDLVFSRSFRDWVLMGDTPETEFWTHWAARNPDRAELIEQAKSVIYALQMNQQTLPSEAVGNEVQKVLQKLRDGRLNLVREIPFRPGILGRRRSHAWTIAAILAIIGISILLLRFFIHKK
jgi:hypothetical protein